MSLDPKLLADDLRIAAENTTFAPCVPEVDCQICARAARLVALADALEQAELATAARPPYKGSWFQMSDVEPNVLVIPLPGEPS